ncbi:TIGR00730 family Rossman fold protein [Paroceanicella profunda]|uniref:Cytokinin riboside 5'-monophosphate phosphoribohydrolase n=1 Tax=Paroceanicella profunda TaxID=2579971 RepID=A0A5B8FHU6_9RHOB|nr:TIGR00730 family Rossman fold protein [Paroceanicella profunda]QDL92368.1 TIGR00730 family Rossman fold protein [Paroceanicella profunda]
MSEPIIRDVCVFCGSRTGVDPSHVAGAERVGALLAEAGMRLVYGAGDVGIMGAVARAARAAGGEIFGVVPEHLLGCETAARSRAGLVVTQTMHERKKVMFMNADAIVALPGGPGTLDELFEVLTWRQLGLHAKPVVLGNFGGYWTPLLALIDGCIAGGFADATFRDYLTVCDTPEAVIDALRS